MEEDGQENGASSSSSSRYYFHCESEILKYNKDYQSLLRTLGVLEAQKIQAIKDLEVIEELKSQAKSDPAKLLTKLKEGSLSFPTRQTIVSLPDINWEQYGVSTSSSNPTVGEQSTSYNMRSNTKKGETEGGTALSSSSLSTSKQQQQPVSVKSKGKKNKPGQPWTEEEQARLEELLQVYPPEDIEAKRWQKIASALVNRTPKQVCCRVQKYFIKLAKAGLPVPGRMPNLATYMRKGRMKGRVKGRLRNRKRSIFFNSLKPRVYMDSKDVGEEEDEEGEEETVLSSDDEGSSSSSESVPSLTCSSCHVTLSCVYWECVECEGDSVTLCQNCVNSQWSNGVHCSSHEMKHVSITQEKEALKYIDKDYTSFNPSLNNTTYNYLDSNFRPAL